MVHWFRSQRRGVGLSVTLCSKRCIELQVGRERLSFLGDWEKERERARGENQCYNKSGLSPLHVMSGLLFLRLRVWKDFRKPGEQPNKT